MSRRWHVALAELTFCSSAIGLRRAMTPQLNDTQRRPHRTPLSSARRWPTHRAASHRRISRRDQTKARSRPLPGGSTRPIERTARSPATSPCTKPRTTVRPLPEHGRLQPRRGLQHSRWPAICDRHVAHPDTRDRAYVTDECGLSFGEPREPPTTLWRSGRGPAGDVTDGGRSVSLRGPERTSSLSARSTSWARMMLVISRATGRSAPARPELAGDASPAKPEPAADEQIHGVVDDLDNLRRSRSRTERRCRRRCRPAELQGALSSVGLACQRAVRLGDDVACSFNSPRTPARSPRTARHGR